MKKRLSRLLAHASLVDRAWLRKNSQRAYLDLQAVTRSWEALTEKERGMMWQIYEDVIVIAKP